MLNIVIPANNEEALIGRCLSALLDSESPRQVRIIVVANGCKDRTAEVARGFAARAAARGWTLEVVELAKGHKPSALNAGDAACGDGPRAYLDADVVVGPDLVDQIAAVLDLPEPAYTSGQVRIARAESAVSRAYARIWAKVPFMVTGVPGCGLFAVNPAGRARWGDFPDLISDDTFVRLQFRPEERHLVPATYDWPVVEGLAALVRVRRRQEAGVAELRRVQPDLFANDDKPVFGPGRMLMLALRDPVGFAVYAGVGAWAKLTRGRAAGWSRGR